MLQQTLTALAMADATLLIAQLPTEDFILLSPVMFTRRMEVACGDGGMGILDQILLVDISGDCQPRSMLMTPDIALVEEHLQ